MTPRQLIAVSVLLLGASLASAAPEPTVAQARAIVDKAVAGFENGAPAELGADDALVLETAPVTAKDQIALYRRLPALLKRAQVLRALRTPAKAACTEAPAEGNACVQAEARAIAAGLGIADKERAEGAASIYLAYYIGPKNNSPAEMEAAQKRALEVLNDPKLSQASAARAKRVLAQTGALKLGADSGDGGFAGGVGAGGVSAGGGRRTVDQALEEARRSGHPGTKPKGKAVEPPSLSERLASSAEEDARILELGKDDGTWSTAVGRAVTQGKKTGSQLLSYFTSGETWKSTGQGALSIVGNPGETFKYMPGAIKEGAGALWKGVKSDISNASDEVGNFIENPTPYRGMAVVGSVGLAVSNAFVVGGGAKSVARQGAKTEVLQGTRQATKLADNLIGAVDDSLDFTVQAVKPKPSNYMSNARAWKAKGADGGFAVESSELKGRIGVDQKVYGEVEGVGVQRGSDCARFGITTCSIANGRTTTKAEVEKAATTVMINESTADVARLEERLRALKASGGDTASVSDALVKARSRLTFAEIGGSAEYGLSFDSIGGTLREMKTPHRSLGYSQDALRGLQRGETPQAVLDFQRKIDGELVKGNAVMAGIYTGSDGAHSQHAITILGKGRDAAGKVVYEIYDSNVGRVAQIPAESVKPFGAVVVGSL